MDGHPFQELALFPIRYLVNTSYHGDHCYGNFIFPAETTVIGHELTKAYIDTKFEADRTFMLGLIGPGRGIEEVVPRSADLTLTDRITLDLGERKVEILHIGFAQTEGDVIVWLPEEKIVFVGNMIQAPPPALPWLLEGGYQEAIVTLRRLHQMLDDQAVIIPGHGRPMRRADILFSVQYLAKLGKEVEAAGRPRADARTGAGSHTDARVFTLQSVSLCARSDQRARRVQGNYLGQAVNTGSDVCLRIAPWTLL